MLHILYHFLTILNKVRVPHCKIVCSFGLVAVISICYCFSADAARSKKTGELVVNVVASSALGSLVSDLARGYSRYSGVRVSVNFGAPALLAKSISDGVRADVFISEDREWIDSLKQEGMLDVYSTTAFAETSIEILCGGEKPDNISLENVAAIKKDAFRLAVCDSNSCILGMYSKEFIDKLKTPAKLHDKITEIGSLASLEEVVKRDEICGIFYSFANVGSRSGLWKAEVESALLPKIQVRAAVVAGENMQNARGFIEYLKSGKASEIALSDGFARVE